MIGAVIKGIIEAVRTEFGAEYQIHDELPAQGLKEPAFYVKCVASTLVHNVGLRHTKAYAADVAYFPKDTTNPATECLKACERLLGALQGIMVDGKLVRVSGELSGKTVDGVLHVTGTYSVGVLEAVKPDDNMETLEQETSVE